MHRSLEIIALVDADGVVLSAKPAFGELLGVPLDSAVGRDFRAVVTGSALSEPEPAIRAAQSGKLAIIASDPGEEGQEGAEPIELALVPLLTPDGAAQGFGVALQSAGAALRADPLDRALDANSRQPALLVSAGTGMVARANEEAAQLFGYSAASLEGQPIGDLVPDLAAPEAAAFDSVTREEAFTPKPAKIMTRAGLSLDFDVIRRPTRCADADYVVLVFSMNPARAALTDLLRRQSVELSAANRDLAQFASVASHDLRGPLIHISNLVSMVLEDYSVSMPEDAATDLRMVVERAIRLQTMVSKLLEYSRLADQSEPFDQVDLSALAGTVAESLEDVLHEAGARVEIGALPTVRGSASLLTKALEQLFDNALKFRSERPLEIRLHAAAGEGGDWIFFEDNGIGIPPEHGARVFDLFRRLSAQKSGDSVGLGLSICRRVLELHGGQIKVDPEYRQGVRVAMFFPDARAEGADRDLADDVALAGSPRPSVH